MSEETKRRSLGRGLSALFGDDTEQADVRRLIRTVPIERVLPGKYQPRQYFDEDALDELADSIRDKGILQPLLVRLHPTIPQSYELIAGERRWRAAQRVPLHEVPVIVRDFGDRETLEIALIENLQRADLNPIEEATAYMRLMEEFSHTQLDLSRILGKSRSHIANVTRLLGLPERTRTLLQEGKLSAGHARALIGLEAADDLAHTIVDRGLTVRQVEAMVQRRREAEKRRDSGEVSAQPRSKPVIVRNADIVALERDVSSKLGYDVSIVEKPGGAVDVTIHCDNLDQLDELLKLIR